MKKKIVEEFVNNVMLIDHMCNEEDELYVSIYAKANEPDIFRLNEELKNMFLDINKKKDDRLRWVGTIYKKYTQSRFIKIPFFW